MLILASKQTASDLMTVMSDRSTRRLVLASTSPYRRQLFGQLGLDFVAAAPRFEEYLDSRLAPELLVRHLALEKARSLVPDYPDALIIGADQVFVDSRNQMVGKPGSREAAIRQLTGMQGRSHTFYTGLAVVDSAAGTAKSICEPFTVTLRPLDEAQIRRYVEREAPLDCAGSFKIEGLGIALMERLEGRDYTALIGLPLIRLVELLGQCGVEVL